MHQRSSIDIFRHFSYSTNEPILVATFPRLLYLFASVIWVMTSPTSSPFVTLFNSFLKLRLYTSFQLGRALQHFREYWGR